MSRLQERGFTMPELLVVIALFLLLTASTFLLLRPASFEAEQLKAERRLGLAAMAQALQRYKTAAGHLPTDVPAAKTAIGSGEGAYDLCRILVPMHLPDLPLDPEAGLKYRDETLSDLPCSERGVEYLSGYIIARTKTGDIILAAPTTGPDALSITVR